MSVENLIRRDISPIRAEQKKLGGQSGKSPAWIVAEAYINQGKEKIRLIFKRSIDEGINTTTPEEFYRSLTQDDQVSMRLNHASILMGIYFQTIEKILVNKSLNLQDMLDKYNSAITLTTGTPLPKMEKTCDEQTSGLSMDAWRQMVDCAKSDPTLATFFAKTYLLPLPMQQILTNTQALGPIQKRLLPAYKEQYQILAEEKKKRTS